MVDRLSIWSALTAVRGFGVRGQARLAEQLDRAGMDSLDLLGMSSEQMQGLGLSSKLAAPASTALSAPPQVRSDNTLVPHDPHYPPRRHGIPPAIPPLLHWNGSVSLLDKMSIGVSGSRSASPATLAVLRRLIVELAHLDDELVIVSGNADGVDAEAHTAAVDNGLGTIAVLAEGLDRAASRFDGDDKRVLQLSQFPSDRRWSGPQAMARNETIAALSNVVVLAAAGESGGSLKMGEFCLKHSVPLAVFDIDGEDAVSNSLLIEQGGVPLDFDDLPHAVATVQGLLSSADDGEEGSPADQGTLF